MVMPVAMEGIDARLLWKRVEEIIKQRIPAEEFDDWFENARIMECIDDSVILGVPSGFRREYIEENFKPQLDSVFSFLLDRKMNVAIQITGPEYRGDDKSPAAAGIEPALAIQSDPINENYVFETFVVGACNKMAHAAALAVSKAPAQSYNPLFVYGGVGLGKTHLMQAIGNNILRQFPSKSVAYLSAEQFVNSFIDAIKRNERLSFQANFRNVDVLLIDDIQFLAGKESTQEEFFHTFNALHNRKKQIVISSDRPPKDIPTIEDRLRSRFEWGLIVDIAPPDFEMRMAILRQKCESVDLAIPDEVLEYIANKIRFSIRELEGALAKITAYAQIANEQVDVETVGRLLGELYERPVKEISIEKIQRKVAEYYNIKPSDIIGKNRSRSIARPRQIAMYLSRKLTKHSYPEIGTFFGNKDHTTVLFACNKIGKEMEKDSNLRSVIDQISDSFSRF
ncbi:MAG: chromosomal replication initiator protein DnaA [bacterium]|nr:chromosomal replication initiator protein DnaA [bacterium]